MMTTKEYLQSLDRVETKAESHFMPVPLERFEELLQAESELRVLQIMCAKLDQYDFGKVANALFFEGVKSDDQ